MAPREMLGKHWEALRAVRIIKHRKILPGEMCNLHH